MSVADPDKQSISSSVFKLSTNLGQMFGVILMEILFSFSLPEGFKADGTHASMLSPEIMTSGFRWAYASGAALCLIAMVLCISMKDNNIGKQRPEDAATMV